MHAIIDPLRPYLAPDLIRLRRGFLSVCATRESIKPPPEIVVHPVWSTVESIETVNLAMITTAALISARRLATDLDLELLRGYSLGFEKLVGRSVRTATDRLVSSGI